MTNVKSLLEMYVKMGGSLTDTYADIAGGVPVGQYSTISDAILACSKKYSSGGGGAEKFVVTLTADDSGAETVWTADKTIAEIVAAYEADKIVVAKYPTSEAIAANIPISVVVAENGIKGVLFVGTIYDDGEYIIVFIRCINAGEGDMFGVETQIIPIGDNAPLVVTMTEDQNTTGKYVGDQTCADVYTAIGAGRNVVCSIDLGPSVLKLPIITSGYGNSTYVFAVYSGQDYFTLSDDGNGYISFTTN